MVRTQIQLTEQQAEMLRNLALREDVSIAELIRRSINNYFRVAKQPSLEEKKRRSLEVVGKYSSGHGDVSQNHDQYLANIYAEIASS